MTKNALVIGGTRNLGHFIVLELLRAGWNVTLLNRGRTPDELPASIERLRADRTHPAELRAALQGRSFDAVVDTALYTGAEAREIFAILRGRVGRYVFISSGQVYLVRVGATRPYREEDYDGPLLAEPPPDSRDHGEWLYGIGKREAEDVFAEAWARVRFPFTSLRLPMVISERDHYGRVQAYLARMDDGGPILLPREPGHLLRPVYAGDVASFLPRLLGSAIALGRAYNLAQPVATTVDDLLELIAELAGRELHAVRVPRRELVARGFLPDCSPFSARWLSELDAARSVAELGITYTPLPSYMSAVVQDYRERWRGTGIIPPGYEQRSRELASVE